MTSSSETQISDDDFGRIATLAQKEAGIILPRAKRGMVQSRVFRDMRKRGYKDSVSNYIELMLSDETFKNELLSILTTNVTGFLREPHHFNTLREYFTERKLPRGSRIRIWSAGCSAGHEPFSIAMTLADLWQNTEQHDLRILGTDIDKDILSTARSGAYSKSDVSKLPESFVRKYFERTTAEDDDSYHVNEKLSKLVSFRHLNLHSSWPFKGPFDAIFCRNVVIYFSDEGSASLWPRFHDLLVPGGLLFIGHSERIHPLKGSGFEPAGITTFRKIAK